MNRATQVVLDKLKELGCDPIEGMARIALDQNNAPDLRGKMFSELAQYCFPKRKAIEISDAEGNSLPRVVLYIPDNGRAPHVPTDAEVAADAEEDDVEELEEEAEPG